MAESLNRFLPDPAATTEFGASLARAVRAVKPDRLVLYLTGQLGAGKTALTRAVLAGLGHQGRVPSPTYTLVEPYSITGYRLVHVDLYRLENLADVDDLALSDYLAEAPGIGILLFVEWPERGIGRLPAADLRCHLTLAEPSGRQVELQAASSIGQGVLDALRQ
ncbi:MAG: tRNA (adenosine(37)-N6)-threonylcarbamoyltransferase complex ATPase subunit type 1 TsaE [Gammaproteobacteria bacterium]